MRGQWYIVAAVLFSFSLLTLFNIFNSYSRIDYTSVLKNDEDLIFPNLVEELNKTVENSENIKNLNADVGDLLEMAENSLIGKGYFFRYNLSTSNGFNLSNLELAGKNLKINYKYYRLPSECVPDGDNGICPPLCTEDDDPDCCQNAGYIWDSVVNSCCGDDGTSDNNPSYSPMPGWRFRQEINISNTAGDLTDYQVKITVDYDSDMQSDYDDLRFVDANSNNLSYWIENYTSSKATVWVNVTFLESNTNTTIYMYYGNPDAISKSNGENTFLLFDNFDDGTLDTTKWGTFTDVGALIEEIGGYLHLETDVTDESATVYSNQNFSNIAMRYSFKTGTASDNIQEHLSDNQGTFDLNGMRAVSSPDRPTTKFDKLVDGTGTEIGTFSISEEVEYLAEIQKDETLGRTFWEGSQVGTDETVNAGVRYVVFATQDISDLYVNWGLARNYTDPEPSYTIGSEESLDDGTADNWCNSGDGSCVDGAWFDDHCNDNIQNCDEVGVDCGGLDCLSCSPIPGWSFRQEINISNTAGDLTDYQVKIQLNSSNFDYSKANSTGKDIRFTNSTDDQIDYWIEKWDTTGNSYIWVKVPFLESNTNTTIYMYYGNSSASSASNRTNTMNFVGTGQLTNPGTIDETGVITVDLSHSYNNPVVVAYIATRGGGQSIDIRARNVGSNSFELFEEEPDNAGHNDETNNWIVAESGSWIGIDGELRIEAGTHSTASVHKGGNSFGGDTVNFENSFSSTPSVLATLNTYNNGAFMSTHTHSLSSTDFLVEQEAAETGISASTETIGWITFSRNSGTNDGISYEVGYHPEDNDYDGVSNSAESVFYSFGGNPSLVIQGSTPTGTNGYWARGAGTFSDTSANFYAEEDQKGDSERWHVDSGFSWATFYTQGSLAVHKYTSPEPTYTIGSEEPLS